MFSFFSSFCQNRKNKKIGCLFILISFDNIRSGTYTTNAFIVCVVLSRKQIARISYSGARSATSR